MRYGASDYAPVWTISLIVKIKRLQVAGLLPARLREAGEDLAALCFVGALTFGVWWWLALVRYLETLILP